MNAPKPLDFCRILYLAPNSKAPDSSRFPHGHLDPILSPETLTENYGIVLDDQYICVDIDDYNSCDIQELLPLTWAQKTKKGAHHLYLAPPNFKGGNVKLKNKTTGAIFGDLKSRGYIVGPGSTINDFTYTLTHYRNPSPFPRELLSLFDKPTVENGVVSGETAGVPNGEHDEFLFKLSSWLRGRYGLTEHTIAKVLEKGPLQALEGTDPTRPYTRTDLERIAHSTARKVATREATGELLASGWTTLGQIDTHKDPTHWILHRFIPRAELVLMFGKGGLGKSTWASWVAAHTAKKNLRTGFAGVEEPFLRFGVRAWLTDKGIDTDLIYDIGNQWQFPRDAEKLREALLTTPLDVVYFDSIYNHFEPIEGQNMAERTRTCLSPLARIAQELGVTIIGTFHENKAGDFLGSVEMVNVARIVLHATRGTEDVLKVSVKKTNFLDPGYALAFTGERTPGQSLEGEPWLEENERGELVPEMIYVIKEFHKTTGEDESKDEVKKVATVLLDDV